MASLCGASCAVGAGAGAGEKLPVPLEDIPLSQTSQQKQAVFASGCFWCSEAVFEQIPGVVSVLSGYAGDSQDTANYETVSSGQTNHAESVQISYDASKVTYGRLLQVFFSTHDPTTPNRQGPDTGRQYRSAIFYANDDEKRVAQAYVKQLETAKSFSRPIVTTFEPLKQFYPAEQYHQDYAKLNPFQPYIQRYAIPKAEKAKKLFGAPPTTQPSP